MPGTTSLPSAQDGGLSLIDVLQNIPLDPAAVFVYLLVAASLLLIWKGSRPAAR